MKLLIDTNVILDVLLKREPYYQTSAKVLNLAGRNDVEEYVSASAVTDIFYISYRMLKDKNASRDLLKQLLTVVSVAGVSEKEIHHALDLDWQDFEDSVQYSVASLNAMDGIVTRNVSDYQQSDIPIWNPEKIVDRFA